MNVLLEILASMPVEEEQLEEASLKFYKQIKKFFSRQEEEEE